MLFGERQRYILPTCVVAVIAMAGAEASHRQGGQIWTFTAPTDGASSDAAPSLTDNRNFDVKGLQRRKTAQEDQTIHT